MSDRGMPDHHLSEDSVTRSAEAFLRVGDLYPQVDQPDCRKLAPISNTPVSVTDVATDQYVYR